MWKTHKVENIFVRDSAKTISAPKMERNNKTRLWWIAFAVLVIFMSEESRTAAAGPCVIAGPRYRLRSDTVDWSMRIESGQNCSSDFQLNTILSSSPSSVEIESVKLISPPRSGQVTINDTGLSYAAKTDFQGRDTFTVAVSGAINRIHGSSTIRIVVSNVGVASTLAPRTSLLTSGPLPRGLATPGPRNTPPVSIAASSLRTETLGSSRSWSIVKIGAGGFLTGMDMVPDGTVVVRTNVYGAYIWNGAQWQQLVTSTSLPTAFVKPFRNEGVYEIQIAPSNSKILYMMFLSYVFKSTNKGATWLQTSFTPIAPTDTNDPAYPNPNNSYHNWGQKMAIDPNDPNIVYVGTPSNGLFKTIDGGAKWNVVSGVPAASAAAVNGILFDPANANIIFAASYGNGVYQSTDGGADWTKLTNGTGPSNVQYAAISSTGVYYAVDGKEENLWAYTGGTWTKLISGTNGQGSVNAVAVNPSNPDHIIAADVNGRLNESFNGGTRWSGWTTKNSLSATDAPWQDILSPYLGTSALFFNPLDSNELLASGGNDFFNITLSGTITTSTSVVWIAQGVGIEELVSNEVIVPPGGNPIFAAWDRPLWDVSNPNVAPSTYGPVATIVPYTAWSVDYASSDPSFIVALVDNSYYGGTGNESGYSTNGGQTWTLFPTDPPGGSNGGTIAASTPSNVIWASASGVQPYYTLNGGETWSPVVLPGVSSWSNFDTAYFYDTRTVTADRVLPNTFYLYYPGYGVYESTNGGVSWTQVSNIDFSGSGANSELQSVPGEAGNLFWSSGPLGGRGSREPVGAPFYQSTNGGATWTAVPNVLDVNCFGFGAPAPGQSYPTIYIVGWVNDVYGIWQSYNDAQSWTQIGVWPLNSLDQIKTISGDPNIFGQVYIGFAGSGFAYLRPHRRTGP